MALEYFSSGKYHEALLLFQKLDKNYKLNARFRAYIGVCYYHEWDYKKAVEYLDETIPQLEALAPHERNVYYYADAESHFILSNMNAPSLCTSVSLPYATTTRKGMLLQARILLSFLENWANAHDYFLSAGLYYRKFRNTPDLQARLKQ